MYKIGDIIVYSAHGLCQIDDICERTVLGETRTYYVMHPLDDKDLTISCPVDSDKVLMLSALEADEAAEILQSFRSPGLPWVDDYRQRTARYREYMNSGDRMTIARMANTLMYKELELGQVKKHLYETDRKMLADIKRILFHELALSMDSTYEKIESLIGQYIAEQFAERQAEEVKEEEAKSG